MIHVLLPSLIWVVGLLSFLFCPRRVVFSHTLMHALYCGQLYSVPPSARLTHTTITTKKVCQTRCALVCLSSHRTRREGAGSSQSPTTPRTSPPHKKPRSLSDTSSASAIPAVGDDGPSGTSPPKPTTLPSPFSLSLSLPARVSVLRESCRRAPGSCLGPSLAAPQNARGGAAGGGHGPRA